MRGAQEDLEVHDAAGGLLRAFRAGERIFMEQSRKFDQQSIRAYAAEAGMEPSRWWMDDTYLLVELRAPAPAGAD